MLGGYDLAYSDLIKRFGTSKKLLEEHVKALRELPRRFSVKSETDIARLERLRQEAWSHVNALRSSEAPMTSFEVLAAIGSKESLPCAILIGYFKEYDSSDDDDEVSDAYRGLFAGISQGRN